MKEQRVSLGGSDDELLLPSAFPPPPPGTSLPDDEAEVRQRLFPNVPAADRLLKWQPGLNTITTLTLSNGDPLPASTHIDLAVNRALRSALEPSTRENYGYALSAFLRFCFELALPVFHIFPISEGLLLAFVSAQAGSKSSKTVTNYLSGLKAWHETWNIPWASFPIVTRALQGVSMLAPEKKPLRPPIEIPDLLAVRFHLDVVDNPLHAAVWACATMSFWGVCRLGETTCPSSTTYNPGRHVSRGDVGKFEQTPDGGLKVGIKLPWTKTTKRDGMVKTLSTQDDLLDPIQALRWHITINVTNKADDSSTPLFAYKVRAGKGWRLTPLSKNTMLSTFSEALRKAGRPSFTGHSFRIGGATYYDQQGATPDEIKMLIKMLGGWASDSFRKYLRDPVTGVSNIQQRL